MTHLVDDLFLLGSTEDGNPGLPDLPLLVCGAALADLDLGGRLDCPTRKVEVVDATPTGHPVLDDLLGRVGVRRGRTAGRWVFDTARDVAHKEADHLAEVGLVSAEQDTVLGLLPRSRYPLRRPDVREPVLDRVRAVVLADDPAAAAAGTDPHTRVLISLLGAASHTRRIAATLTPELDGRALRSRLASAATPHWAAAGTQRAVRLVHATRA